MNSSFNTATAAPLPDSGKQCPVRVTTTVKSWLNDKGYGFAHFPGDPSKVIFIHTKQVKPRVKQGKNLVPGEEVECSFITQPDGRYRATAVTARE